MPTGVVIPLATCREWPRRADDVVASLRAELRGLLAVRSSALAEDLGDASFAGLYASVLGVDDEASLHEAIAHVIDSARGARVPGYDERTDGAMAVLVQRQVDARAAGVAFTADPLTGERDVALVHAVRGLGESLVSGIEDPEEWILTDSASCRHAKGVLSPEDARAVAELARGVEAHEGLPVDIEWAIDTDRL